MSSNDKSNTKENDGDGEETMILSSDQLDSMGISEGFQNVQEAYREPIKNAKLGSYNELDTFRRLHCEKGQLVHKGQSVSSEMAEHIFSEVHFKNGKCNVCNSTCEFDIIKERLSAQEELLLPKVSNDWFTRVWENMRSANQ